MNKLENLSPSERLANFKKNNPAKYPKASNFEAALDFPLDDFQREAIHALEDGKSLLVAAPTGAGKTIVGEFASELALLSGGKTFYTTPIKALSNQKYQEFVKKFGAENVGLLTGDASINSESSIVIMTTEVLRNMIYAGSHTLENLRSVVMDEVHYLADRFRGAVWEEVIIHLPESVQIVALSATVSNAEEFGDWIRTVRGDTKVVLSENRPIPLFQHILIGNRLLELFQEDRKINPEVILAEKEIYRRAQNYEYNRKGKKGGFSKGELRVNRLSRADLILKLEKEGLLPSIQFIFSRAGCDRALSEILHSQIRLNSQSEISEIRKIVNENTAHIPQSDLSLLGFYEWQEGLERGVAAHHAGLLPIFKETVEKLFQKGLVKVVFATETLALGINMPAKSVYLEKLSKYNGQGHVAISPGEFTQLTGRAGRRGIDIEGHSIIAWYPEIDTAYIASLATTRTYPLKSSFSPSYNMAINLMRQMGRERARKSLESSFAQYQADKAVINLVKQRDKNLNLRTEIANKIKRDLDETRYQVRLNRLDKENEALNDRIAQRTSVIARRFDQLNKVLEELGYIEGEIATAWGEKISEIYGEKDLLIAESLRTLPFAKLTPAEFIGILSTFTYEPRSNLEGQEIKIPKGASSEMLRGIVQTWVRIHNLELNYAVEPIGEPEAGFINIAFKWASGHSLAAVLSGTSITVGDFVRQMKQIIDLARQIKSTFPEYQELAKSALEAVDRGVLRYIEE